MIEKIGCPPRAREQMPPPVTHDNRTAGFSRSRSVSDRSHGAIADVVIVTDIYGFPKGECHEEDQRYQIFSAESTLHPVAKPKLQYQCLPGLIEQPQK